MKSICIKHWPKLKRPVMMAAWPGVSNVALEVVNYLHDKLKATEFAFIEPMEFFTPSGIIVEENIAQALLFPQSKFYYVTTPKGKRDLILFIGEAQPDKNQYELAHAVLDVAQMVKVKRIYTSAAAIVKHNVEKSRVWTAATSFKLLNELKEYDVTFRGAFQIRGFNGLLLAVAKEKGMEGICLLGETPQYAINLSNPMACHAVLEVLNKMLGLELDLSDIAQRARETAWEFKSLSQEATVEYLNRFTAPIWEEDSDENDDEGE